MDWNELRPAHCFVRQEAVALGPVHVVRRTFGADFRAEAAISPGASMIALLDEPCSDAQWNGLLLTESSVALGRGRVHLRSTQPGSLVTAKIDHQRLTSRYPRAAELLGGVERLPEHALLHAGTTRARRLRDSLRRVLRLRTGLVDEPKAVDGLIDTLSAVVTAGSAATGESYFQSRRLLAVRTCQEYIVQHKGEAVSLVDLSRVAQMRPRSLINAFQAITGLSPMAYLRAHRLNRVRKMLCDANATSTRIIDVATEWGFWHMGHFTAAYWAMFGETPSETLRGAQRRCADSHSTA